MPHRVLLIEALNGPVKRGLAGRIHLQALFGLRHPCPVLAEFLCEISL